MINQKIHDSNPLPQKQTSIDVIIYIHDFMWPFDWLLIAILHQVSLGKTKILFILIIRSIRELQQNAGIPFLVF